MTQLQSSQPVRLDIVRIERIYREHADYLYNLAHRLTGSPAEADDLVQETFLRVARYLDSYAGGSLRAWVRRILVNRFLTRTQMRRHASLDADEGADALLLDCSEDPAQKLEDGHLSGHLQEALDSLPADYRTILVLRELDDLSYEQIAGVLECPIGTVRSRLARARGMLRDRLCRNDQRERGMRA